MNINRDDPKWTAYVLGELDKAEHEAVETELESSEEARAFVEELQVAATALQNEIKIEVIPQMPGVLAPEQRAAITAASATPETGQLKLFKRVPAVWAGGLAVAALILFAVVMPSLWKSPRENAAQKPTAVAKATNVEVPAAETAAAPTSTSSSTPSPSVEVVKPSGRAKTGRVAPGTNPKAASTAADAAAPVAPAATVAATAAVTPQLQVNVERSISPSIITGFVADTTNALIPGVVVTATNTASQATRTTLTNESGAFTFSGLLPGPYRLTASLQGFQTALIGGISLGNADTKSFTLTMRTGNVNTVEVGVSSSTLVAQSSASIGQALPANQVRDLPIVGNNVLDLLAVLQQESNPARDALGFAQAGAPAAAPAGPRGGGGGRGGAAAGAAAGGGRGTVTAGAPAGIAAGVLGGRLATAPPPPAGAPPPPPPSAVRTLPDNRTLIDGLRLDGPRGQRGNESYNAITDNPFIRVSQEQLSTFSSDVDTASYSNVRRYLNMGQIPPRDAVRIEEMINYFPYDYAQPSGRDPIGAQMEVASAPWSPTHRLVRIGIKARDIDTRRRPPSNLVFLIDVSGSMQPNERLPLIKSGLKMLVENLTANDHVSIVTYAGASGVVLQPTSGDRKDVINRALESLEAGGSTNGSGGIQLAYQLAVANFVPGGVNRVILATDGDFNVGVVNQNDLVRLIQDRAKSGVFLSVLGVGMGNLKDSTMERLADSGNGNYAYIDSLNEAHKVLVEQMGGTLVTVAKDVKLQVEFNPAFVEAYRLIGYENRLLAAADFNNDRKDAGDMGAGHTVTALYEIVPRGGSIPGPDIDPLKYQPAGQPVPQVTRPRNSSNETLNLKIRYKDPDGTESKLITIPLVDREGQFSRASADFRFAATVAEFGMILRDSPYRGNAKMSDVLDSAQGSKGSDRGGYRQEFIGLVERTRSIRGLN